MTGDELEGAHLWCDGAPDVDAHVGFRAVLELADASRVRVQFAASWWVTLLVDGVPVTEGPPRAPADRPEHVEVDLDLSPGTHLLALHALHPGVHTERANVVPAHVWVASDVPLQWSAAPLPGVRAGVRRLNPNLGFVEWWDTRELPDWTAVHAEVDWPAALRIDGLPTPVPDAGPPVLWDRLDAKTTAEGVLVERLLLPEDDPAAVVAARDLAPDGSTPADGVWFRFDLGRVRLGRPELDLEAPSGTAVDLVYCEDLVDGRATPWISMSNGPSANLDHYVLRGGRQRVGPASPRSGRWVEVHVLAPPRQGQVQVHGLRWVDRGSIPALLPGALATGSALLDRIWEVGVDTLRACSEDALVDCPVRERGQWLGDAVVGMEIAAVSSGDLRLVARSLRHAAAGADVDGFVAGQGPGSVQHLASYSALWPGAVLRHAALTGDDTLLTELAPAAVRNAAAFASRLGSDGVKGPLPWPFIDWGAAGDDLPLQLLALEGLEASARWLARIEHPQVGFLEQSARALREIVLRRITQAGSLGYHAAALALRSGLVSGDLEGQAVQGVLDHLDSCFPLDPAGPRLSSHLVTGTRFVTPYFLHFSLVELARRGRGAEVMDRIEGLYGWLLDQGATTWWENFDPRWSRCHQWAGTPTWLLSRCLLGLWVEQDGGLRLRLVDAGRQAAQGRLPLPGGGVVDIDWVREGAGITWSALPDRGLTVRTGDADLQISAGERRTVLLLAEA